jgi:hypothetical protein
MLGYWKQGDLGVNASQGGPRGSHDIIFEGYFQAKTLKSISELLVPPLIVAISKGLLTRSAIKWRYFNNHLARSLCVIARRGRHGTPWGGCVCSANRMRLGCNIAGSEFISKNKTGGCLQERVTRNPLRVALMWISKHEQGW